MGGEITPTLRSGGPTIQYRNTWSQISGVPQEIMGYLAYDLSYRLDDPKGEWDGYRSLISRTGGFLSGLLPRVVRVLQRHGISPEVLNERGSAPTPVGKSTISLRDYQTTCVDAFLAPEAQGRGVIFAPPRSGKTRMGASVLERIGRRTVWVAPTKAIVAQTIAALTEQLGGGIIGHTGAWPKKEREKIVLMEAPVVVLTAATAARMPGRFFDTRDVLVIDEFHHAAAEQWHTINRRSSRAYYRLGLTGTHWRSDPETEILMEAVISRRVAKISVASLIQGGYLARPNFYFVPTPGPWITGNHPTEVYRQGIVNNAPRNSLIAHYASTLAQEGRIVLILVGWKDHGRLLAKAIPGARFVCADDKDVMDVLESFNAGRIPVLIGTSILGEGVDLPAADALIYAKGQKATVTVTQDIYRVLTRASSDARGDAIVIDFVDTCHPMLQRHSVARATLYGGEELFQIDLLHQDGSRVSL